MAQRTKKEDAGILAELAVQIRTRHTVDELTDEFASILASSEAACFIKYIGETPVGFTQCQLRHDYVEGTSTSPVGYLEGIFVLPEYQKRGIAKDLLRDGEEWAKTQGCTEFASDCEIMNDASIAFHQALGFTEANRIACFTKKL